MLAAPEFRGPTSSHDQDGTGFDPLDILVARASPAGFAWLADGANRSDDSERGWLPYPHLTLLSDHLLRLVTGEFNRLLVTMPPRHGKSALISETLPAWFLGTYPRRKVILASATADLAHDLSKAAREKLEEYGPEVFGVRLKGDSRRADRWQTEQGGIMKAAGIGGLITGRGAHLLIIDDPVKDAADSFSEVKRAGAWNWYISTPRTRLQKNAAIVVVMTRWHEDDLAGRVLEVAKDNPRADQWKILNLPAFAEDEDALGRDLGEALCPGLIPQEDLEATQATQTEYFWSAMYQQRPRPAEGLMFKARDFRYWRFQEADDMYVLEADDGPKPYQRADCTHFMTVDVAASEKQTADYTVVALWAVTIEHDLILVDRKREQFETLDVGGLIERSFREWDQPSIVGIEDFGFGLVVVQELVRRGLPIVRLRPDKDKVSRAMVAVARYEEHRVWHPRGPGYGWVKDEWEPELLAFDAGKNDDQVDVVAYAARQLPNITVGRTRRRERRPGEMAGVRTREM